MANTTYRILAARLVELGLASEDRVESALEEIGDGTPDLDAEVDEDGVLDILDELGVTVWVSAGEIDDLEDGYREILEGAAAVTGGAVSLEDVELVEDEHGEESLHFLRNGESLWWAVEHESDDHLDLLTVAECIDDLEPAGGDPRMFYALPSEEPGDDDVYLLATPAQARALHDEFGLDLEGLDREMAPPGEEPTADPGTFDWYMQKDRGGMSEPARAFLDGWTGGMTDALAEWRKEFLPDDFPFDFSLESLDDLEPLVLEHHQDFDSVIVSGTDPFMEGAVRYLGEALLREVPSRWGYQDQGLSDSYDRIPMIRSNTPLGFMQTVVPLHRLATLAKERQSGILTESADFLQDAVDAHQRAITARRG